MINWIWPRELANYSLLKNEGVLYKFIQVSVQVSVYNVLTGHFNSSLPSFSLYKYFSVGKYYPIWNTLNCVGLYIYTDSGMGETFYYMKMLRCPNMKTEIKFKYIYLYRTDDLYIIIYSESPRDRKVRKDTVQYLIDCRTCQNVVLSSSIKNPAWLTLNIKFYEILITYM